MSAKFVLGLNQLTNKVVHVSQVISGLGCNCICPKCHKNLVAAKGFINAHHFRHYEKTICTGAPETTLHLFAKQIIQENRKILIKDKQWFEYSSVDTETVIERTGIKPDALIKNEGDESWLVEILVTHAVDSLKVQKIKQNNLNAIEIDLRQLDRTSKNEEIRHAVLNDPNNRRVICFKQEKTDISESPVLVENNLLQKEQSSNSSGSGLIIGIIVLVTAIWSFFNRQSRAISKLAKTNKTRKSMHGSYFKPYRKKGG